MEEPEVTERPHKGWRSGAHQPVDGIQSPAPVGAPPAWPWAGLLLFRQIFQTTITDPGLGM